MNCSICGSTLYNNPNDEHHLTIELTNEMRHYQLPSLSKDWRLVVCAHCAGALFDKLERNIENTIRRMRKVKGEEV